MDNLLIYIVKANVILILVWSLYRLVLRNLSFHNWKRWFLLIGLAISVLAPLVTWTSIETTYVQVTTATQSNIPTTITTAPETPWTTKEILMLLALVVYVIGALYFTFRLLKQHLQLRSIRKSAVRIDATQHIYEHAGVDVAFSYGKNIFINPKKIQAQDLPNIILHEQKHIDARHGLDLWVVQIYRTLFWYNPILRWYQQEILQNHEWIVDEYMTQQVPPQAYQLQLVKYHTHTPQKHLANSFAISNLKKRILFMNQKPTSKWKLSLFATSFLALAGVTTAMAFDKKENIVYLETAPLLEVVKETSASKPTVLEQNTEHPQSTKTNSTKDNNNKDVVAGNPLIVVDGKIYERDLSTITPESIASMDILKGKEAIDKYGQAGSNGVIIITSKNESSQTYKVNIMTTDTVEVVNPRTGETATK